MNTLWIDINDITEHRGITVNIDAFKSLDPFIRDAQELDVRPFLGTPFYLALCDAFDGSPVYGDFSDLFTGSRFTYDSKTYDHPGLLAVLVHFAVARLMSNANVHSTKYGFKVKTNEFSEEPTEKTMARMIGQARSEAIAYQERVKFYLDCNSSDFPLWDCSNKRRRGQMRVTAIGGNSRRKQYNNGITINTTVIDPGCGDDYVNSGYVE